MAEIVFDAAHVSNCAQQISSRQKSIMNLVNQANATANGLSGWQGSAADQFRATFNQMQQKLSNANDVINTYVQFLNEAVENHIATENETQQDVVSFENGQ